MSYNLKKLDSVELFIKLAHADSKLINVQQALELQKIFLVTKNDYSDEKFQDLIKKIRNLIQKSDDQHIKDTIISRLKSCDEQLFEKYLLNFNFRKLPSIRDDIITYLSLLNQDITLIPNQKNIKEKKIISLKSKLIQTIESLQENIFTDLLLTTFTTITVNKKVNSQNITFIEYDISDVLQDLQNFIDIFPTLKQGQRIIDDTAFKELQCKLNLLSNIKNCPLDQLQIMINEFSQLKSQLINQLHARTLQYNFISYLKNCTTEKFEQALEIWNIDRIKILKLDEDIKILKRLIQERNIILQPQERNIILATKEDIILEIKERIIEKIETKLSLEKIAPLITNTLTLSNKLDLLDKVNSKKSYNITKQTIEFPKEKTITQHTFVNLSYFPINIIYDILPDPTINIIGFIQMCKIISEFEISHTQLTFQSFINKEQLDIATTSIVNIIKNYKNITQFNAAINVDITTIAKTNTLLMEEIPNTLIILQQVNQLESLQTYLQEKESIIREENVKAGAILSEIYPIFIDETRKSIENVNNEKEKYREKLKDALQIDHSHSDTYFEI